MREYELIKRLSKLYNVFLFVVTNTYPEDFKNVIVLKEYCANIKVFPGIDINSENNDYIKYKENYPDKIIRVISDEAKTYLDHLIENKLVDLIHLESFYMKYYVSEKSEIPIVLATQNIEFDLLRQEINYYPQNQQTLEKQYNLLKKYEIEAWKFADMCIALTKYDRNLMSQYIDDKKIQVITNGFDHFQASHHSDFEDLKQDDNSILITGNYQYKPNKDAVLHFCKNIFPNVQKAVPHVKLLIVGNQPTKEIKELEQNAGIEVIGKVESLSPYLKKCGIFACPLRIGGGIKVKMLEALSHKCAIVTTEVGAQGLENTSPEGFLQAQNDSDFTSMAIALLQNKNKRRQLQKNTQNILHNLASWDESVKALSAAYESLIN
ncbi:MAG: glycosyltransferase family 4 protein [Alphaproteobacteria bacterium]|nr:glycosyltransferase family 4 protein [Alphaproteobacteria bacterium]